MVMQIFRYICAIFLLFVGTAHAVSLKDVRVEAGETLERVAFSFNERVEYQDIFTLKNPDRLVIDLPLLTRAPQLKLNKEYGGHLLNALRMGQFDADTSRIVVDLHQSVEVANIYSVSPKGQRDWQLVVDIAPSGKGLSSPFAAKEQAAPVPDLAPAPKPKPKLKPLIVIDAGHGGKDPGAIGRSGLKERDITLSYAKVLEKTLLRSGRYRVTLTRSNDRFIALKKRVEYARNAKGDVFISLHADSNPNHDARGFSVYTLSEKASDAESAALARRENKADIISGFDFEEEDEDVANILIDLAQRATKNRSSRLAESVVEHMHSKISLLPNPHRFAGFRVLKAADIPSILVELGFLSNRKDERLLQSREYRNRVAESMLKALDVYFAEHGED